MNTPEKKELEFVDPDGFTKADETLKNGFLMNTPEENLAELIYNKLVLLFATEAEPDIRRVLGIALLNAFFHHTPDREWEKEFKRKFFRVDGEQFVERTGINELWAEQVGLLTYLRDLLTSRDTYWKERVEEAKIEGMIDGFLKSGEGWNGEYMGSCKNTINRDTVRSALLDNLK